MKTLSHLLERNRKWAADRVNSDPEFFTRLSQIQQPEYLWIGCSDSRVPANQIVSLPPGEVFVHRNIANVVVHTDMNCLSVLQYAVEVLQVKHIIVCGHYGCGGVKAAMDEQDHGQIDNWLRHIQDVARLHQQELFEIEDEHARIDRLCELNVLEQVRNVCNTTVVKKAWKAGAELSVHSWIYGIANGILHDLGACISSLEQLEAMGWRSGRFEPE